MPLEHKPIFLEPVAMAPDVMDDLEQLGVIIRLCPDHHALSVEAGRTVDKTIYASDSRWGPHKLISVTVNNSTLSSFGAHPDNEEFLFIGDPASKPLFLVVGRLKEQALTEKIMAGSLSADDFTCLRVEYNDPEVSFFTMLAGVPHGELTVESDRKPPTFYVTEPADMGIVLTDFKGLDICVRVDQYDLDSIQEGSCS